jgi:dTDP-4-dehydrorhamnose 3,5-epimerase
MQPKILASQKIQDLKIITPYTFYDFRGEYVETFSKKEYLFKDAEGNAVEFVEDDISVSKHGVLRGLHGDSKTWKLIQCLEGEIYIVVVDMRKDSTTYLNWEAFSVNEKNRTQILVPAGCANGHLCLTERCIFSYKQSQYYSGMENQFTVKWNDPKLQIFWPINDPMISVRDASAQLL